MTYKAVDVTTPMELTLMITRHFVTPTFLALVLSFVGPRAVAQQSAAVQGVPVNMVVAVEPKHGDEVPTITQQDIMVYQGHDRQPVTNWVPAKGNRAGLALAILIDDSAGLSLGTQINDIRSFIGQQAPTTLIAVGYMHNGTVALAQNFTQDHAAAAKSLRLAQGFSGVDASPYLSISDFIKRWPSNDAIPRREILAITSGIDSPLLRSNRWQFRWLLRLIPGGANTNVQLLSPSIRGAIATVQRKYPNLTEEVRR